MAQLSAKLRGAADGYTLFFCPGCDSAHAIRVGTGPGPRWGWNGNADAPTFTPSILVTHTVPPPREPGDPPDRVCHSFITDGRIQFLGDCTHALAGSNASPRQYLTALHRMPSCQHHVVPVHRMMTCSPEIEAM